MAGDGPEWWPEVAEGLAASGSGHELVAADRLSAGSSRETWSLDTRSAAGPHALVVQLRRGVEAGLSIPADVEAELLTAAANVGVPVPRLLAWGSGADGQVGPWLVSERVDGETIPRRILRDESLADARSRLTTDCGAALAGVHAIDPTMIHGLRDAGPLGFLRTVADLFEQPHPAFELAFRWLEQHHPERTRTAVVHGDFRLGNFIVSTRGLAAVLDWELAHAGDPMEDLGWMCVKAWRFGSELPVGGVGTREELFDAYEEAGGGAVDPAVVHWWEVYGTLRWGVICMVQAERHRSGTTRSVELATIGRRVCETEDDLLELLP